jgi:delta1-piperideine-2-carboxylate reductase
MPVVNIHSQEESIDRETRADAVTLSLAGLADLTQGILRQYGLAPAHVTALKDLIIAAERDECASHGVYRLAGLVRTMQSGKVNLDANPVVAVDDTAIVRVDADRGFSPLAFNLGRPHLADKARKHGIAAMAINRCVHFTALWPEVEALAEDGLVSLAMTPSHSWVAPAGGIKPLLGTNPFAFGWPRPSGNPYVFDFATSVVARGEVELHRQRHDPIPDGWAIDGNGRPTNDAAAAMSGALLTFGGHKGSALSTMIELIAGPLIGDLTSAQSQAFDGGAGAAPYHGELIIALCPDVFLKEARDDHLQNAETLLDRIVAQGARLPSQRRYEARERTKLHGITVSRAQFDILKTLKA